MSSKENQERASKEQKLNEEMKKREDTRGRIKAIDPRTKQV